MTVSDDNAGQLRAHADAGACICQPRDPAWRLWCPVHGRWQPQYPAGAHMPAGCICQGGNSSANPRGYESVRAMLSHRRCPVWWHHSDRAYHEYLEAWWAVETPVTGGPS